MPLLLGSSSLGFAACTSGIGADGEEPNLPSSEDGGTPVDAALPVDASDAERDAPAWPPPPPHPYATGLSIRDIAIYQAVRIALVSDGTVVAERNAPVVAGRKALVRVAVKVETNYAPHEVQATLRIVGADGELVASLTARATPTNDSSEEELASTLNFELDADRMTPGIGWSVALHELEGPAPSEGVAPEGKAFPRASPHEDFGISAAASPMKLVVVPIAWGADGSNRLPDVSEAALTPIRERVMRLYPVSGVAMSVRAAVPYNGPPVTPDGSFWGDVLATVVQARTADAVGPDTYYVGLFRPNDTSLGYCPDECLVGLVAGTPNATDTASVHRTLITVDYEDLEPPQSVAHELGHLHGRLHAPGPPACDVAPNLDPRYPYPSGGLGVPGYDVLSGALVPDEGQGDLMGYCLDPWVSDYTYRALFERTRFAGAARWSSSSSAGYRIAVVDADGVRWAPGVIHERLPEGDSWRVRWVGANGSSLRETVAKYSSFDHLPGGLLFVPDAPVDAFAKGVVVSDALDRVIGELPSP